jgi:hypothetical protein
MPQMSTPVTLKSQGSFTILASDGSTARTGYSVDAAVGGAAFTALSAAIGDITNGAIVRQGAVSEAVDNPTTRQVFDEAYQSARMKVVLVFQNATRKTRKLEIAAPDASIFLADGQTVDPANADVVALVAAYKAIIDLQAGPYTLVRGFLSSRTRKVRGTRNAPAITEPGSGSKPPIGPGA